MINLCLALLVTVLVAAHLRVPFVLLDLARRAQADFDRQIFNGESCRSSYDETNTRTFKFSENDEIPCYFERIDFGTIETKSYWPKSVCLLLRHVHGKLNSSGEQQCDYQ